MTDRPGPRRPPRPARPSARQERRPAPDRPRPPRRSGAADDDDVFVAEAAPASPDPDEAARGTASGHGTDAVEADGVELDGAARGTALAGTDVDDSEVVGGDTSAEAPDAGGRARPRPRRRRPAGFGALGRLGPAGWVVALVVALDLAATRHLLRLVTWPNDLPFHLSMVDWATGRWQAGQIPTDGWYPRLSGGLPQFHLYQSLPHVLTGALGTIIGPERAVHLVLWLLVGTWPVAVYVGARALGLSRPGAAGAAVVAPLVRSATGYGFEPFSYLWLGNGLWSQAWGMWTAPLALGWSARAVREGARYGRAVAAVALTVAFHLPTAWFVLLAIGLWAVVRPSAWRRSLPRVVGLGALSAIASAWVLVPFLVDRWAANDSSFNGEGHFADSFGARRVFGWFFAGDVIDAGRLPVLSAVAGAGLCVALVRWRRAGHGGREVVAIVAASLVLFVGRDPFGPLISLLPGSSQVFLHRYVATLQLGLVLAVGVAADAAFGWWRTSDASVARPLLVRVGLAVVVVAAVLVGPVRSTDRLLASDRSAVDQQIPWDRSTGRDLAELVAIAEARGGGRVSAGRLYGAGRTFRVGGAPVPIWLADLPVDSIGFTLRVSALAADLETYLDDRSVADLDAFGVRYVLVARGTAPPDGTWFVAARGDVQLWEVPGDGLVSAVDLLAPAVEVSTSELAAVLLPLMRAQGGSPTAVQQVHLDRRSPVVEATASAAGADRPGTVTLGVEDLDGGRLSATTEFARPGALVVKANWHPRWHATVDGKEVPVVAVAPTWLAVPVPAGEHRVELRYEPWGGTWFLGPLAVLAVAAGASWSRRSARSSGSKARATGDRDGDETFDGSDEGPGGDRLPARVAAERES